MVVKVNSSKNAKYFCAFDLFLILRIRLTWRDVDALPKLFNFSKVGIRFEFVALVFEKLIKLVGFYAHFILLYNLPHHSLHLLLFLHELHHQMEDVRTDVSSELLLSLFFYSTNFLLSSHFSKNLIFVRN